MRDYKSGKWGFCLIWGIQASVFPRAFALAVPNAVLAFLLSTFVKPSEDDQILADNAFSIWAGFNTVLFFVLSFRSNVAYNRWWEGGTLLQQTRGEWFNAYSSLVAFTSSAADRESDVEGYHHMLARLMSLLFCSALQQVSPKPNRQFEIIDSAGIDPRSMEFLNNSTDKVEVLLQWIQRSTILNMSSGVLTAPPPVMSRAFQEISRGIVNLQNARKIADFPFPFPYAQTSIVMLIIHWAMCPILASMLLNRTLATTACFAVIFFLWCINFIAMELESPFGTRDNDLPMEQMQMDWNKSVVTLLAKRANQPPKFYYDADLHGKCNMVNSDGAPLHTRTESTNPIAKAFRRVSSHPGKVGDGDGATSGSGEEDFSSMAPGKCPVEDAMNVSMANANHEKIVSKNNIIIMEASSNAPPELKVNAADLKSSPSDMKNPREMAALREVEAAVANTANLEKVGGGAPPYSPAASVSTPPVAGSSDGGGSPNITPNGNSGSDGSGGGAGGGHGGGHGGGTGAGPGSGGGEGSGGANGHPGGGGGGGTAGGGGGPGGGMSASASLSAALKGGGREEQGGTVGSRGRRPSSSSTSSSTASGPRLPFDSHGGGSRFPTGSRIAARVARSLTPSTSGVIADCPACDASCFGQFPRPKKPKPAASRARGEGELMTDDDLPNE